jgi:type IV secretory pathway VirB2 component (pilin)
MYRHLSNVLLGTIIASVACLIILICLIGYAFTTGNNVEQKALASISGVIIAFINGAIYKYVREYQKSC